MHLIMAKKNRNYEYEEDDELVLDKKTKRRLERAAKSRVNAPVSVAQEEEVPLQDPSEDALSHIALLCQENRWREAVLFCRTALVQAEEEGREDVAFPLSMALGKLEMSLRRQMASAFLNKAREMLKEEYSLDVGR